MNNTADVPWIGIPAEKKNEKKYNNNYYYC
jgi:hypothetical protein